jgi:hypothetical protein
MITAFGTGIAERVDYDDMAADIEAMEQGRLEIEVDEDDESTLNGTNGHANGNGSNGTAVMNAPVAAK